MDQGVIYPQRFQKGHVPWHKGIKTGLAPWRGKKRSLEDRKKMSDSAKTIKRILIAIKNLPKYKKGESPNLGRKHSEETCRKNSLAHKGQKAWNKGLKSFLAKEKHYNWQGGITPLNFKIRNSFEYRQWQKFCLKRDDYTCQICGKRGSELHVDHIKPFSLILKENNITSLELAINCEELWNLNNGRTLCVDCHRKTDTYKGGVKKFLCSLQSKSVV